MVITFEVVFLMVAFASLVVSIIAVSQQKKK